MYHSSMDVYETKRQIITFAKSLVPKGKQVESKFVTQAVYGILRSESVILRDIAVALKESVKIENTIDRLSQRLAQPLSKEIHDNYTQKIMPSFGEQPVFLVDDTDIVKPYGEKFEALGRVRDGSSKNKAIEKGYLVTEIVGLTKKKKHPISLFSHVYSSHEKEFKSANKVLLQGLEDVIGHLPSKGTFIFDRGYDMNALFQFMHRKQQNFIIRLTEKRKLFWKGKWFKATTLRDSRKGKIKTNLTFREDGKKIQVAVYISHLNIRITANKNPVNLVLIYGLGNTPMMLATNLPIQGKSDVIRIARHYMSRWRIEEYFRFKKQHFGFENFRVRSLRSINNLNQLLTYAIGVLGTLAEKMRHSKLVNKLLRNARALRKDVQFYYYQLAEGISSTLAYARQGVQGWFTIRSSGPRQLMLKFT